MSAIPVCSNKCTTKHNHDQNSNYKSYKYLSTEALSQRCMSYTPIWTTTTSTIMAMFQCCQSVQRRMNAAVRTVQLYGVLRWHANQVCALQIEWRSWDAEKSPSRRVGHSSSLSWWCKSAPRSAYLRAKGWISKYSFQVFECFWRMISPLNHGLRDGFADGDEYRITFWMLPRSFPRPIA